MKWAASLDGRAAASDGTSQWITGPAARADVHRRRAAADAIVVGTGTVLADDPALTARAPGGEFYDAPADPRRVRAPSRARRRGGARGIRTPPIHVEGADLAADLRDLQRRGIRSLFVEGGPTLASAFLAAGLVDELLVYVAPVLLGGARLAVGDLGIATIADARRLEFAAVERLGDDLLVVAHPVSIRASRDSTTATRGTDACSPESSRSSATVTAVEPSARTPRASPCARPLAVSDATHGDSISVSGVCLTVVDSTARLVHRRRHGADARHVDARRRRRRAAP